MNKQKPFVNLLLTTMFLLCGCRKDRIQPPFVPSLKAYLQLVDNEVKQWSEDAYLDGAIIPLEERYIADIFFIINSSESIVLTIYKDGSLHFAAVTSDNESKVPIATEDWPIDSQEALNKLFEFVPYEVLTRADLSCSYIHLYREWSTPITPILWNLTLSDCDRFVAYYFISALTGERVEIIR